MASIGAILPTHCHITQSSKIHGQTHQLIVWWITTGCLLVKGRWSHLKATLAPVDVWQASETSHSKSNLDNFQHQYMAELLVNVCLAIVWWWKPSCKKYSSLASISLARISLTRLKRSCIRSCTNLASFAVKMKLSCKT